MTVDEARERVAATHPHLWMHSAEYRAGVETVLSVIYGPPKETCICDPDSPFLNPRCLAERHRP